MHGRGAGKKLLLLLSVGMHCASVHAIDCDHNTVAHTYISVLNYYSIVSASVAVTV
jgi:hypothetical protein